MIQSPFARANRPGRLVISLLMGSEKWCRGTELNCRHQPFQGCALPTELPRHGLGQEERGTVTGSSEKNQAAWSIWFISFNQTHRQTE